MKMLIDPVLMAEYKLKSGWGSFTNNCGIGYRATEFDALRHNLGCSILDGKHFEEMEDEHNLIKHIENQGQFITMVFAKTEAGFMFNNKPINASRKICFEEPKDPLLRPFRETLIRDISAWSGPTIGLHAKNLKAGQLNIASFSFARTQTELNMFKESKLFDVVWWSPKFVNAYHPEPLELGGTGRFPLRNILAIFKAAKNV